MFLSFHAEQLLELLREDLSLLNRRTVVFCNTTPSCDFIGHYLTNNGISHIKLHSTIAIEVEELGSSLSISRAQTYPVGMGLQTFHRGGKQTYLVGFRAYPTHPYQFERRPRNGNGYADLHSGVGDLPSWNQGLQTYPMGIRACRLHSGDEHADLSHGAVGSTQWRRA